MVVQAGNGMWAGLPVYGLDVFGSLRLGRIIPSDCGVGDMTAGKDGERRIAGATSNGLKYGYGGRRHVGQEVVRSGGSVDLRIAEESAGRSRSGGEGERGRRGRGVGRKVVVRGSFGPGSRREWEFSPCSGWVPMDMMRAAG